MEEITQSNFRILLPRKIVQTVMLLSQETGRDAFDVAREFYASQVYRNLERERTKYWWLSPEQLEEAYHRAALTSSK